jgi:hypothetical protein
MTEAKVGASKMEAERTNAAAALPVNVLRLLGELSKLDLNNKFRIPPLIFRGDLRDS